jgi:hypothetical protein
VSAPEYELRTVQDFLKVPEDRRALCLHEFGQWLEMAARVELLRGLLDAAGAKLTNDPFEAFCWVDDDKGEARFGFTEEATGKDLGAVTAALPKAPGV